jgi:hypothetical protein
MRIGRAALIAWCFVPIDPPREQFGLTQEYLCGRWEACGELGVSATIEGAGVATVFAWPEVSHDPGMRLIAAKQLDGGDGVRQAFLFAKHDTVGVVVCLAPNRTDDTTDTWVALAQEWRGVAGRELLPEVLLGEASLLMGVRSNEGGSHEGAEHDAVWSALADGGGARGRGSYCQPLGGVGLWEAEAVGARRCFAALAMPEREGALERWVWRDAQAGLGELPPFGLYLLHAGKLRYQVGVYRRNAAVLSRAREDVDRTLERVLDLHVHAGADSPVALEELVAAQAELSQEQARSAGLLFGMTRLRELRQTVTIAARNIEALSLVSLSEGPVSGESLVGRDVGLAQRLAEQIEYDLAYAEAVRERAREAQAVTGLRLQAAADRQARLQSRLTLLQSSLLGALLAALAAIQTLEARIPVDDALEGPLTAFVFGLALAFPLLIVQWYERYRRSDYAAFAVFGATAGWVVIVALWRQAPVEAVLVAVAVGTVFFVGVVRAFERLVLGRGSVTPLSGGGNGSPHP